MEASFTKLLATLPDDYPDGDMALDGAFRLALRRLEKRDHAGALSVLERALPLAARRDKSRGSEHAGRERYFHARTQLELGDRAAAADAFEALVRELPLSYYMLLANSRLATLDAERARRAVSEARAATAPPSFLAGLDPSSLGPELLRAMELLRVGDIAAAREELDDKGLGTRAAPELLWAAASLYGRAGVPRWSHAVARGLLARSPNAWPDAGWERAWQLAFPRPHHAIVLRESAATGVPEALIYGVMREESAFDERARSPADAIGLMQLIVPTAALYAKRAGVPADARSLERPSVNIALGSRALAALNERFADNPWLAVPGYNAGPGRPRRWLRERGGLPVDLFIELIPFDETRRYTKRVLTSRATYALLYGIGDDDPLLLPLELRLPAR